MILGLTKLILGLIRLILGLKGLILGLRGLIQGLKRLDFKPWRPCGADLPTDGRTDGWTSGNSPLCPTGHRPFGAAAQKGLN